MEKPQHIALSASLLFLSALTAAAAPKHLSASNDMKDRAAIEAEGRRMDRAFETRRMNVWNEVLTPDFRGITPAKTYNKAEFIAGGTAEAEAALSPVSVDIRHVALHVQGLHAAGESRELTCYGVRGTDGLRHRLCYRQRFSDRWRKEGAKWQLSEIRYSPHRSFRFDGKLISREEMRKLVGR